MYYLRKEPIEIIIPAIHKTNGDIIPERQYMTDDRAIYKSTKYNRFYRQPFRDIDINPVGMKLYTCKTLKRILNLRDEVFNYCGEWFDVYDEKGKVTNYEDSVYN